MLVKNPLEPCKSFSLCWEMKLNPLVKLKIKWLRIRLIRVETSLLLLSTSCSVDGIIHFLVATDMVVDTSTVATFKHYLILELTVVVLKQHFHTTSKIVTLRFKTIQNDLIHCCTEAPIQDILQEIRANGRGGAKPVIYIIYIYYIYCIYMYIDI